MKTELPVLQLKKNEERRLQSGHGWVYSNEVDNQATPLSQFEAGQCVLVRSAQGKPLGSAYVNPHSLICARLYTRRPGKRLDEAMLRQRLSQALALRQSIFDKPYYRLCYSEGDGLPGLIVDRFADYLTLQINTAGMERLMDNVIQVLVEMLAPQGILVRNDMPSREFEGLPAYTRTVHGDVPERVELEENQTRFQVPLVSGQKTGWYYDHRFNRARMQSYAASRRVLDVFSYVGGWGLQALRAGAEEATCLDESAPMLEVARQNAEQQGMDDKLHVLQGDAFAVLNDLYHSGKRYSLVILDPPAFIKRKKDYKQGVQAYRRINQQALRLLDNNGILISASCSYHLSRDDLLNVLRVAAKDLPLNLQVLEQGHLGADHPLPPAIAELDYLKAFICHIRRD